MASAAVFVARYAWDMLPRWENSQLVLPAAHGTGNWIGAAGALAADSPLREEV
jgi:hypothetical protein